MWLFSRDYWGLTRAGVFAGTPPFTSDDLPDQTGKVSIVTGGNTGMGKETCLALVAKGGRVYMGARSRERAEAAIEDIKRKTNSNEIFWLKLDLSDLESVIQAAEEFQSKETALHTLYNNAGVMAMPYSLTKDGFEVQWGTNVVGHFVLTKALLPILKTTAAANPSGTVRVINTSSSGHEIYTAPGGINFGDINLESFGTYVRYGQSKLGNILMTKEIARRFAKLNIHSLAVHPGLVETELTRGPVASWGSIMIPLFNLFSVFGASISSDRGALTQLWAGTSRQAGTDEMNGKYLVPYAIEVEPSAYARDPELAERLWEYLESATQHLFDKSG